MKKLALLLALVLLLTGCGKQPPDDPVVGTQPVKVEYSFDHSTWLPLASDSVLVSPESHWEPGASYAIYLRLTNVSTMDCSYKLWPVILQETPGKNVLDQEYYLSSCLRYSIYTDAAQQQALTLADPTESRLLPLGDPQILTMRVYMPETAGNEVNYKDVPARISVGLAGSFLHVTEVVPTTAAPTTTAVPRDPVETAFTYEKAYVPYEGRDSSFDHSLTIPLITQDTPDAAAINERLMAKAQETVDTLEAGEEKEYIFLYGYLYTNVDGVLGIRMSWTVGMQSAGLWPSYEFIYYDMNTGKELTYDEYLTALGLTRDGLHQKLLAQSYFQGDFADAQFQNVIVDHSLVAGSYTSEMLVDGYGGFDIETDILN